MAGMCRGIVIAGNTNRSRTQMAEGFIRRKTGGLVFVTSGGTHFKGSVHPHAVTAMREVGIDITSQSVNTLATISKSGRTYDVYVSIDAPQGAATSTEAHWRTPEWKRSAGDAPALVAEGDDDVIYDPLLVPPTPSHWVVSSDPADAVQGWQLWSPRDPSIAHENSTRKFQDHLYAGEPLFPVMGSNKLRSLCQVKRAQWVVHDINVRFPLETDEKHLDRFRLARDAIALHADALLASLEEYYGDGFVSRDNVGKLSQ